MRYHVNPETGNASLCRAEKVCPFAPAHEHTSSLAEARESYEKRMNAHVIISAAEEQRRAAAYNDATRAFVNSLPENERKAIEAYVNQEYDRINENLWAGNTHALTENIDAALAKANFNPRKMYRKPFMGNTEEEIENTLQAVEASGEVHALGYSSYSQSLTSLMPLLRGNGRDSLWGQAEDQQRRNVIFEVSDSIGAPVSALSHMPQEHEWLLPRNLRFEVVSMEHKILESTTDTFFNTSESTVRSSTLIKLVRK